MKRFPILLTLAVAMSLATFGQTTTSVPHSEADKLSQHQLVALIATAKTPAEHLRLARYYQAQAKDYLAQSQKHEEWAEAYKKNPGPTPGKYSTNAANHCEFFAQSFKDMAAQMQDLADMHERMAKTADR